MKFICAATGRIGSRVIESLHKKGETSDVIAGVRNVEKAEQLKAKDVQIRQMDYNETDGILQAFERIERVVFLPSHDDSEERAQQGVNAIRAAESKGVRQFILISIMDSRLDSPLSFARAYGVMEETLMSSTLDWTILRTSMYTDNLAEQFPVWLERKELVTAAGQGKISYVSRDDITASIVGVLSNPIADHSRETYTLTGPEAHSYEAVAEIVSELFKTDIIVKHVSVEEFARDIKEKWGLAYDGVLNHVVRATPYFQLVFSQGFMEKVTDHVKVLSGNDPESVTDWLRRSVPELSTTPTRIRH